MSDKINDAKHWRDRAAEIRLRASQLPDGISRRVMLAIAETYDILAQRAEQIRNPSDDTEHKG
jgi:hypothetical protein